MTEELDAVLFDAGGVLWDLNPSVEDLFADALSREGVEFRRSHLRDAMRRADRALDDDFARLDGRDESAFWRRYDGLVLDDLEVHLDEEAFARGLSSRLKGIVTKVESWVPYRDAVPALEDVRNRGLVTGMVSNATDLARRVLRNLDMEKHFDLVVISEEVGVRKPDPRIFEIALDRAGAAASRTMFLGDKPATDIAGATGAGIRGVLVDRNDTFPDTRFPRIRSLESLGRIIQSTRNHPASGGRAAQDGSSR